jgi:phospholipase/carboxylesterase
MNRLFPAAVPPAVATHKRPARVEQTRTRWLARSGEPHSFFAPLHYEANYAYPLIVWLHSAGGDERQLARIMPLVSMRNYVGLGVRGPLADKQRGYLWPQTADGIDSAAQRTCESIEKARDRFNIHPARVFLAGYESGGTMALRIALRHPGRFAAAASIGGPLPQGQAPLSQISQLRRFPLLLAHCRDSQSYPVEQVCQELSLVHSAGLSITLRQYPCGDELTTRMLHDLDLWLMEQVTGVESAAHSDAAELPIDWN